MTATPSPPGPLDALRFAFGTLTVLPVTVTRWDRATARGGMAAAPLAGVAVGLAAAAAGTVLLRLGSGPLLAAVAAVAVPAALTRGLHLDGLADTADALGSAKPADEALRIMKRSDIGPFGVIVLVLALLAQVAALGRCYAVGWVHGSAAAVVAGGVARAAMTLACRAGVPAARPEGLGAAVAGAVPRGTAAAVALACVGLAFADGWRGGLAAAAGLCAAEALLLRCVRRFGGVTGDVFGALEEVSASVSLVLLAFR